MPEPVIMFGVGAAKAGTSWLHRYLDGHPQCHFRAIKELQYFNTFDQGDDALARQRCRIEELKTRLVREVNDPSTPPHALAKKIGKLSDVEHYLKILQKGREDRTAYREYLFSGVGDARIVGDVTPAYSLLSEARVRSIASIGDDVRFVYLMRDPVQRFWSHVRMIARSRCKEPGEFTDRARNVFRRALEGEEDHIVVRSDYRGALARLKSAVAPSKLCVEIYENLFQGQALARICAFLGISYGQSNRDTYVNEGLPLEMTERQRVRAADFLAPQYEAVREYFGKLPAAWETTEARTA